MFDKKENTTINLGEKASYVEVNEGIINNNYYYGKSSLSKEELLSNINSASIDLSSYENKFQGKIHIDRNETKELYNWIIKEFEEDESRISLLVGSAGYGKSVVLKDLLDLLNKDNIPTLGIKADKILNISSLKDIESELNLQDSILSIFQSLCENNSLVVLLIDQIDALSQSLSSSRHAINSYDRLIKQLEIYPNVRILISCRIYDLDYDPILRSYKGKKIFKMSLLDLEQVNQVLSNIGIDVNDNNERLKEFLRIPLHLNLFCKVGTNKQFDDNITLQKLYDEIWDEYIGNNNMIDPASVVKLLTLIAEKMHEQQHIVIDKRLFNLHNKELQYLLHHDLLKETTTNKVQFIHQTFFDYVYARTFIASGKSITAWLKEGIHQGLFIRSQVKQIFSYLRDLDVSAYIKELKELLLENDYRFHLKLLLINDLGFYQNPLAQEKKLVIDHIIKQPLFFRIFLESIQSPAWFKFIIEQNKFRKLLSETEEEINSVITNLCIRMIWQDALLVINFLSQYPQKIKIIENVLVQIPESEISLSYDLYEKTSSNWNVSIRSEYYFLEKALKSDPDFVILNLKKDFDENLSKIDWLDNKYIPGGYGGLKIYSDLYKQYPNKAVPYFLYIIEEIIKSKRYESLNGFYWDRAFYLYRPNPDLIKNDFYDYKDLYDTVLCHIKNKLLDEHSISMVIKTLESKYANVLAIGVYYLLENRNTEVDRIFSLFTQNDFFSENDSTEILDYYAKELLSHSYSLLTDQQQEIVNQNILFTKKDFYHWTHKDFYTEKKVRSNYLSKPYSLISMISESLRNRYPELKRVFQEGFRKYGISTNVEPQEVSVTSGWKTYSQKAYSNMSFDDWKTTFIKLDTEERSFRDWDKPTKEGNKREFEKYVSEKPMEFYPFVESLIPDKNISIDYILAGLEGLQKGNYSKDKFQDLCLEFMCLRKDEFSEIDLSTFLRVLRYVVRDNQQLDKKIFFFIKNTILQITDREFSSNVIQRDDIGMEVVTAGINSTRGSAVELMVDCYSMVEYKDEIFETLEYIADTANEVTRSCAIFNAAKLNNLDKRRAFDLYLRLVKDLNPYLLAIPFHDGHPLLYHMNINFKKLEVFFYKAITVKEAGKPMGFFLLNAYLNNRPKGFTLLKKLLNNNTDSRQELAWFICANILNDERHANKGWKIINYLLNFDDEKLGEKFNNCFLQIPPKLTPSLIAFLNKYVTSPVGKYKGNYFYDFLRKLISFDSYQCLVWFFNSQPDKFKYNSYERSPINILIEAYNGIREYEKDNPILERAMDAFDSLLQIPQYRNLHLRTFLKELTS